MASLENVSSTWGNSWDQHFLSTRGCISLSLVASGHSWWGNASTCAEEKLIPRIASCGKVTFPNIAINKQMVRKKLIKVFIWCDEKWHQEVEYQKFDFYFQSGIRRLRFGGTEMVFWGYGNGFGGTEMVFNDYKSQPPDATFHYFDIVVGNAYWVFLLIWSYVL